MLEQGFGILNTMTSKTTKVYLAADFSRKDEMRDIADSLTTLGMDVVASWVYVPEKQDEGCPTLSAYAVKDLDDVDKCDVLVCFTYQRGVYMPTGGGRHVEVGYALAKGKKVVIIGPRENVFHHHPSVQVYETLGDWLVSGNNGPSSS